MIRKAFFLVGLAAVFAASNAFADTIFYVSPEGADPVDVGSPEIDISGGGTGTLNVYAQTTDLLSGVSLDFMEMGGAIRFTSSNVLNGASLGGNRWSFISPGAVSADGRAVESFNGGALIGLGASGIGPGTQGNDFAYTAGAGFLLGTIGYEVLNPLGAGELFIKIGGSIIGDAVTPIRLGSPNDAPVDNIAGAASSTADATFIGIPEPASITLFGLALIGLIGLGRRRS